MFALWIILAIATSNTLGLAVGVGVAALASTTFGYQLWLGKTAEIAVGRDEISVRSGTTSRFPLSWISTAEPATALDAMFGGKFVALVYFQHRLFLAGGQPPNVRIRLRRPVRLGLMPIRWYREMLISLEGSSEFLQAIQERAP
jgi:hypothetical protein